MLRGIIICPDEALAAKLVSATQATGEVTIAHVLNSYPTSIDLSRAVRTHSPEVVFLSFDQLEYASEVVRFIEIEAQGIQIIGFGRQMDQKLLREAMRAGVREFLTEPFTRQGVADAITAVKALVERKPPTSDSTGQIFAFLPAKPGVGASTVALNVSAAIAQRPNTPVVLTDFDLSSGLIRFMLKLENEYSVTDALENAGRLDQALWPKMITALGNLNVLHSGRMNPSLRVEVGQVRALVDFLRRNYKAVCFDLSGNLERYSLEIMRDCKRILLVCTPEIPSLHLAREKLIYLKSCELDTRVSVLLNRSQKKGTFTKEQTEEILGMPVTKSFPNDYASVNRALSDGTLIAPRTDLGAAFAQFAKELMEDGQLPQPAVSMRKFIEFFGVQHRDFAPSRS